MSRVRCYVLQYVLVKVRVLATGGEGAGHIYVVRLV